MTMKPPSLQKIKKQAANASKLEDISISSEEKSLQKKLNKYRTEWDKLREEWCPSNRASDIPCRCPTHPRYQDLVLDKIQRLANDINALAKLRYDLHSRKIEIEYSRLLKRREAILKYNNIK